MAWGIAIAIYLFLAGVGAGAFLTAAATDLYRRTRYASLVRAGAVLSGPMVAAGLPFLIWDLGVGKTQPWRLVYLFLNPHSPMTWGVWILTLFIPVALLYGWLELGGKWWPWGSPEKYRMRILQVGAPLAVAVTIYTGLLIGVVPGVPLWNTTILPALFVISALSTGLAAAVVLAVAWPHGERRLEGEHFFYLNQIHSLMIVIELILVFCWLFISANGSEAASESVRLLTTGRLSIFFWIGVIFFGIVDPLIIYIYEVLMHKPLMPFAMIVSDGSVLLGGAALRYLALAAAVPIALM